MQKFLLTSLIVIGLFAIPPAYAGGGISIFSGLMGDIVGGNPNSLPPPSRPVSPQTQEVPTAFRQTGSSHGSDPIAAAAGSLASRSGTTSGAGTSTRVALTQQA
jgi:hypothetical protein